MYAKIVNEETKICEVGEGTNSSFYKSIGMVDMDVEKACDGNWYIKGYAPERPTPTIAEQNETIRQTRESLYVQTSDKLKADYDEAVARGSSNAEQLKKEWLASKDKIRRENPYVGENNG